MGSASSLGGRSNEFDVLIAFLPLMTDLCMLLIVEFGLSGWNGEGSLFLAEYLKIC